MLGTIRNRHGERLDATFVPGIVAAGEPRGRRDLVVLGHGVTSHKDRPWLIALSEALAARGIASLRISFAGNGASAGRFADATPSKEAEDLGSVLDALASWRVCYAGHSMGGAVGVLRAARDERILALVSLAGIAHLDAFVERHFGGLAPGDLMFGKPHCALTQGFLDDARRIGSLVRLAPEVSVPWLLVHGTADEIVPFEDSRSMHASAAGACELVELEGLDHRFSQDLPALCAAVVGWLARQLG